METKLKVQLAKDALGNLLDPDVKYARGAILRGAQEEARRQQHGLDIITRQISEKGIGALFNLLGVSRAQPIEPADLPNLGFLESLVHIRGKAETLAVEFLDGNSSRNVGFVTNRVSASIIAAMMAMVKPDQKVLCVSPDGRTHPSVKLGIRLAGGKFKESVGYAGAKADLESEKGFGTVVVTTITPQLRHLPNDQVARVISLAKSMGLHTYIDDAHCAIRMVAYNEKGPMIHEPDATAISSDKHIFGPRAGVMVGQGEIMERIRAISLELGIEAPTPILAGVYRALKNHKTNHISRSIKVAKELESKLERAYPGWFYFANDCAALTDENVVRLLMEESGKETSLVPQEVCSALSMLMLEKFGLVTVSTTASPGAAPYLRLVAWPDGFKVPTDRIVEAVQYAYERLSPVMNDEKAVRKIITGR